MLQELNTSVPVTASTADLTDDFLAQFQVRGYAELGGGTGRVEYIGYIGPDRSGTKQVRLPCVCVQVVVLVQAPLAEALRVDEVCHKAGIAFIKASEALSGLYIEG